MIRLLSIIALLFCVSSGAQTWNQADSLTNLLTRPPVVGGWYSVKGYRVAGDWGDERTAQYVRGDTTATNMGNVFSWSGGRLKFFDSTNTTQRISWWGGGPLSSDNTKSLTNAANYVSAMGGGYVKAGGVRHPFLYGGIVLPSGVRLIGDGPNATVFDFTSATPSYAYEPVIYWEGSVAATVRLQSVPTAGDRTIVTATAVDWAWGEMLQIADTNKFSFGSRPDYHQGEFNFVYSNTGGTNIVLQEPLEDAYPTASTVLNRITPATGSVDGIHFALGTSSGPVLLRYCDQDSYIANCSAAGSEDSHFWIDSCYGTQIRNTKVDYDITPGTGGGYGLKFGDSEGLVIGPGNFFRTSIHGISGGGSTIPTRYTRIFSSTFGSTRQTTAGADMHGDVVESSFDGCTFLSGVTLGGGRNRLLNSTVMNGRGVPGLAVGECRYYDWEVRGNRFLISSFDDEAESVWAARFLLTSGDYSGDRSSTNYWPGTFGGTSSQSVKVIDNEIQFTGTRTNGNYAISIDEASTLTANTNISAAQFGAVIVRGNRILPAPNQPDAMDESPGVFIYTRSKIRFTSIDVSENPYLDSASVQVRVHTGDVRVRGNTFANLKSSQGVLVNPPAVGSVVGRLDTEVAGNLFVSPIGSAFTVVGTTGRVIARDNLIYNHGRTNTGYSLNAIAAYDGADPVNGVELYDNLIVSTNAGTRDVYILTSNSLRDERTQTGGSVTAGTRSVSGSYTRVPYIASAVGSTNAVALLGQYSSLPAATNYPPAIAHAAGDLWYSDGSSWSAVQKSGTNFHNLRSTNGLVGRELIAETATIGGTWPGSSTAIAGRVPLVLARSTNAFLTQQIYNVDPGASAGSVLDLTALGAQGRLFAKSTNNTTATAQARVGLESVAGAGIQFDLLYPASMDLVYTYGGGTEFARLSTNTFSLPGLTTLAPTNVPTHVAMFDADPTSTRRLLKSTTVSDLKNSLAITAADITDSTSAGRALLTAANASAQRSSLGLGTIATIDDAPSDGNQYVRSNATWAITSGGGGGSSTNLDNLTVTNEAIFLNGLKTYEQPGNVLRLDTTPGYVNVNGALTASGLVTASGGVSVPSGSASYFLSGIQQGPSLFDLSYLASVHVNGSAAGSYANFSDTTPAAPSTGVNVKWQITSTNVSAYVPLSTVAAFKAQDGEPPASSYATFSTRNSIGVMLFDPAAQEAMRYRFILPSGYSAANATVILKWTTSATSGDARWGARFMALTGDIDSDSFATAVEGTTTTSATAGTVMTTTLSAVGLDSAVSGDGIWLEVYRDVGDAADTINSNDLELHNVEVRVE